MEQRESFVFYRSFYEALKGCPDDLRLQVYEEVMQYALYPEYTPQLTGVGKSLFELIRPQVDANIRKRENGRKGARYGQKGAEYGQKGGRPTTITPQEPPNNPPKTPHQNLNNPPNVNVNANVNANVNVNDNVNDNIVGKPTRTPFIKPTLESVERYVLDKSYAMDAREFYDYYESNGWMVGKNKMKSWTAAVANWARREKEIRPRRAQTVSMPNALVTQPDFYDD